MAPENSNPMVAEVGRGLRRLFAHQIVRRRRSIGFNFNGSLTPATVHGWLPERIRQRIRRVCRQRTLLLEGWHWRTASCPLLEMTPMERRCSERYPYGYMSHVFPLSPRFPMDHPWRASVMSAVRARAED